MGIDVWIGVVAIAMTLLGGGVSIWPPQGKWGRGLAATAFVLFGVIAVILLIAQSKENRAAQKRADDARERSERRQRDMEADARGTALGVENMKGQLSALSVVLGKFVESGKQPELTKIASGVQQVIKNAASPLERTEPPLTASSPPDLSKIIVPGLVKKGASISAYINDRLVSADSKPNGSVYVGLRVSSKTRTSGEFTLEQIQSIVDAIRGVPGVTVFYTDGNYGLSKGDVRMSFGAGGGLAGGRARPKMIFAFDQRNQAMAQQIREAISRATNVPFEVVVMAVPETDIYQEFWKASGIDLEISI